MFLELNGNELLIIEAPKKHKLRIEKSSLTVGSFADFSSLLVLKALWCKG